MSVRIRLQRFGARGKPFYRISVIDSRKKRDGEPIEVIGHYDPIKKIGKLDAEKYSKWVKCGAIPTSRVNNVYKRLNP